ncbi:MAG: hypothetical protein F4X48_00045 [Acidimicrobiia bacterium]|nr:hypothetical protein [Acidimicrobiia bacterium]MYC56971.1 hypothetical protein [Acidimicrobiia bacterium]MYI30836.1 hypothetical protein [Acidimicrobiia bacterium]
MSETPSSIPFDQQGDEPSPSRHRSFIQLLREINARMVLGVLAGLALIIFIAQNTHDTQVHFLGWDWYLPVFLLLLITIGLTMVCTDIIRWYVGHRRNRS